MKELIIYARSGQNAITTANLIGEAVIQSGKYAYSFPNSEEIKPGALINAFVRIDDKPIELKNQVANPDYLIITDSTILQEIDVFSGLKPDGIVVINSMEQIKPKTNLPDIKFFCIPANNISTQVIGNPTEADTALAGAFAFVTQQFRIGPLVKAIRKNLSDKIADSNVDIAKRGFEYFVQE